MNESLNLIKIIGLKNETINFRDMLSKTNSLIIKNCFNVKIIIKSKINKITVEKSNKISIIIYELINGIEVAYSKFILILLETNDLNASNLIPLIDIFKSSIYLVGSIKLYSNIKIICEQSELFNLDFEKF